MALKKPILNKTIIALLILFWSGTCFAAPSFTVDLGAYKTMPAVTSIYDKIPRPLKMQTVICHSGDTYTIRCGDAAGPKQLEKTVGSLKSAGLAASVVRTDLSGCVPAFQFVETYSGKRPSARASTKKAEKPPLTNGNRVPSVTAPQKKLGPPPGMEKLIHDKAPYADLRNPEVMRYLNSTAMMVQPDISTKVMMSNRDINRIVCESGPIKDVVYSKEKGIDVKIDGDNAFVKFVMKGDPDTGNVSYATIPSEFYVVCGDSDVYTLIASPKNIPAQTISLASPGKHLKKNLSLFKGVPFEDTIVSLIKDAYRDNIPDSFTVRPINRQLNVFRYIGVLLKREVSVDGDGLLLKEYALTLKPTAPENEMRVTEKNFLVPELAQKPVGISLDHLLLKKGRAVRLFIVEKRNQEND